MAAPLLYATDDGLITVEVIVLSCTSLPEGDGPYLLARDNGYYLGKGYFRTPEDLRAVIGEETYRRLRPAERICKVGCRGFR